MNFEKWSQKDIPPAILALKLAEEVAEVGTEITDTYMENPLADTKDLSDKVLVELEHVLFIANQLVQRIIEAKGIKT